MSRCKACDAIFSDSDFIKSGGFREDLCSYCRSLSIFPENYSLREYQFESITEMPVYIENFENTVDK